MKKLKKKHKKTDNAVREYFYIFGFLPLIWGLSLPATIAASVKTSFSFLFLDFILVMQIIFVLYAVYEIKSSGYSLIHIYNEHKNTYKGLRHYIVPIQIILYLLIDIAIIVSLFLKK